MRHHSVMAKVIEQKIPLVLASWTLLAGALLLTAVLTIPFSNQFGYDTHVIDMPIWTLFAGLFFLGALFVLLLPLIHKSVQVFAQAKNQTRATKILKLLLFALFASGLLARILMLFTQPMLEDDFQRYLWDGALTANGHNPYFLSPKDVFEGASGEPLLEQLEQRSGLLLGRVNHPELRTIYPPVAQLGFALGYWLKPFSLTSWRLIALASELTTLALLVLLLKTLHRPVLWAALYWLNPLIIKELINAAHMEVLLVPLLLGSLWAAFHYRYVLTSFLLALAVGVKIWPALLLPLYLRAGLKTPKKLITPVLIFTSMIALMALPVLFAGLDQKSGFVAYAQTWKTNSALFPALAALMQKLSALFFAHVNTPETGSVFARLLIAFALGAIALHTAWHQPYGAQDLARKTLLITTAMFLLSPAQFPWYSVWFMPFLAFLPFYGLALLVPALQVYYLSFYFAANEIEYLYPNLVIWLAWVPVWSVLACELASRFHSNSDNILKGGTS
ncbi:MAG: DUF2029 domain-containing protein [bacterium]|nr:DUF2029 domain-containing protein [bacterium]